jgi:hypothetical protein
MLTTIGVLLILSAIALFIINSINSSNKNYNLNIIEKNKTISDSYYHKKQRLIIEMPSLINKRFIVLIAGIVLFIGGIANPISINDAGNRQVIQSLDGKLWVKFTPGMYISGFWSKITTYPNNVTIQVGPAEKKSAKADYWEASHTATFSEGDQALVGHTVKWDLPNGNSEMIELHTTYNTIDNLMTTTLLQYQKETMNYSTQRLSSEGHYSGGQSQLKEFFQDQLRNGQVLLVTETKTRKLEDSTTKTYIEVKARTNTNGTLLRTDSDIQKYKLLASFSSVDYVKYDDRIYEKLKAKIDAASDEATAKQQYITAQQEALTEKAKGEKLIATTKANEESAKLEAVIRAQKEAEVAFENLKRDKFTAQSTLALKRAEAEGDKLKVAAGLSPREKADFEMKTKIAVAKELAKAQVPNIVVGGGGGSGANPMDAIGINFLMDINERLSK